MRKVSVSPITPRVVLFGLSTGALIDCAISSLKTGEVNLFRQLYQQMQPKDVALGDRIFGSYADICQLARRGIDSVFRLHARRKTDFRKGKRLGRYDHIVKWQKPLQCPSGLCQEVFNTLPSQMLVREIRFQVEKAGFRTRKVTLVTTLLDVKAYPKSALCELYRFRWQAEISLRHLKTRMQMEFLPSKTPDMVIKEFYIHLLAYNLIRSVQKEAGKNHGVQPTELSFSATVQHVCIFTTLMASADYEKHHLYSH